MSPGVFALSNLVHSYFAATVSCASKPTFFFIPPWYEYLPVTNDPSGIGCLVTFKPPSDFLPIGLAILDMLLRFAGLAAIIAIIAAGVGYMTAGGSPEKAAKARNRIFNALIGLAIVSIAAGFVGYIGRTLGG